MRYLILLVCISLTIMSCEQKEELIYSTPERITLTGKVLNAPDTLRRIAFFIHRVGFEQEELETELDSTGNFHTYFTSYIPVDFYVSYRNLISMIAHPGDSIYFEFDGSKEETEDILNTTVYSGNSAKLNTEIAGFQKIFFGKDYSKLRKLSQEAFGREPDAYQAFSDSLYAVNMHQYDSFVKTYQPAYEAKNWARTKIIEGYSGRMNWYPTAYRMKNPGKRGILLKNNYSFLKDKAFAVDSMLYCASAISNYVTSYQFHLSTVVYEHTSRDFTPDQFKANPFLHDSILFKTIIDSVDQDLLKQIYLTREMYNYLEGNDLRRFEHFKSFAEKNIQHTFLKQPLLDAYEDLKRVMEQTPVKYEKKLEVLGSFFVQGLLDKNPGKVTYIDIWATWCSPCRDEFKYSTALHKKYGEDVEFIYICIDSEEASFKNALKKYNLQGQHIYLDFNQSKELRKQLNVQGVPYYLLVDQNGKVVEAGFEIRPSEKITESEIKRLLRGS